MKIIRYLVSMLILTVDTSALALECHVFVDSKNYYSFGRASLGGAKSDLPRHIRKSKSCVERPIDNYYDCGYTDSDGVSYSIDGALIVKKEIRDLGAYKGKLIAGVTAGDGVVDVLRKLSALPREFPMWQVGFDADGFILGTDACIQGSNGVRWSYNLIFNKEGRLKVISAQSLAN